MNIFVLDNNPKLAAEYHCDKHVVKMILETAQMLSTCNRYFGLDEGYKSTHVNNPCNKWLRESLDNYLWLTELGFYLDEEYGFRYGKTHKSWGVIESLTIPPKHNFPKTGLTPFAQVMPDEYRSSDVVESYRTFYAIEKRPILTYTKRPVPQWLL